MLLMNYVGIGNKLAATSVMPNTTAMSPPPPRTNLDIFATLYFSSKRSSFRVPKCSKSQVTRN